MCAEGIQVAVQFIEVIGVNARIWELSPQGFNGIRYLGAVGSLKHAHYKAKIFIHETAFYFVALTNEGGAQSFGGW